MILKIVAVRKTTNGNIYSLILEKKIFFKLFFIIILIALGKRLKSSDSLKCCT